MIQTIHLITNPKGGVGDNLKLAAWAASELSGPSCKVTQHTTEHQGHAEALCCSLPFHDGMILCGIGGDGTMHEIINGLMRRPPENRPPVALIPGGTGNSFMEDAGHLTAVQAMQAFKTGKRRRIDLMQVTLDNQTRFAFNVCGWGLFASGNQRADSLRWIGQQRYNVAGLLEIVRNPSQTGTLKLDSETLSTAFSLIVASNSRYVGKGMLLAPDAKWDDGRLDLLFVKKTRRSILLNLFSKLHRGLHVQMPEVVYQQTECFEIHSDEPCLWNLDGEIATSKTGKVEVIPSAIEWQL